MYSKIFERSEEVVMVFLPGKMYFPIYCEVLVFLSSALVLVCKYSRKAIQLPIKLVHITQLF